MRFHLYGLCLLVAGVAFVACSSDDEGTTTGGLGGQGGTGGSAGGPTGGSNVTGGSSGMSGGAGGTGEFVPPTLLSETGLFTDIQAETLAEGVMEFAPAHQLWSDGATKRRWAYLPPNTTIDTADMDFWKYPIGTKLWKEFTRDGTRVETRMIQKTEADEWFMMAFEWNDDESDAVASPGGHENARDTEHDIPDKFACGKCHGNMEDSVLGFTALQLSHSGPGVTIDGLVTDGLLSDPPSSPLTLPGSETDQNALGYLHANCGLCHNDHSQIHASVHMVLWEHADQLESVETTTAYATTVDQGTEASTGTPGIRIVPGDPAGSVLFQRFTSTEPMLHMPPLATEITDPTGQDIIEQWIESLGGAGGGGGAGP